MLQGFQAKGLHPTTYEPFSRGQALAGLLPTAVEAKVLLCKIKIIIIMVCVHVCRNTFMCVYMCAETCSHMCAYMQEHVGACGA